MRLEIALIADLYRLPDPAMQYRIPKFKHQPQRASEATPIRSAPNPITARSLIAGAVGCCHRVTSAAAQRAGKQEPEIACVLVDGAGLGIDREVAIVLPELSR